MFSMQTTDHLRNHVAGAVLERGLGLLGTVSLGVFVFLFMLLSYPAVTRWFGRRGDIPFKRWVLAAGLTSIAVAAAGYVFRRW